jgi:hypothetical protein
MISIAHVVLAESELSARPPSHSVPSTPISETNAANSEFREGLVRYRAQRTGMLHPAAGSPRRTGKPNGGYTLVCDPVTVFIVILLLGFRRRGNQVKLHSFPLPTFHTFTLSAPPCVQKGLLTCLHACETLLLGVVKTRNSQIATN